MPRRRDENGREREDRVVGMVEHVSITRSDREVTDRVRPRVLVNDRVRVAVDLGLVHMLRGDQGRESQAGDQNQ